LIESVASGVPRLDYYTSGGTAGCPALLVEPSAQNLALQSEAFNTTWTPLGLNAFGSGSVANSTGTTDPFGGTNSDYIQENSASGTHVVLQINAGSVSGTNLTLSVFAKSAERTQINLLNNALGGGTATFNLTAGTATLGAGVSASIQNYGNGWYRCILTYTPSSTGNFNVQIRLADASGNTSYTGTGTSGLYVFGAQVETGSVATSYIPTTAAAVTRNADVVTLSGAVSGCIGQTEGTIYAEVDFRSPTNAGAIIQLDSGDSTNRVFIGAGATINIGCISGGSSYTLPVTGSYLTGVNKIAVVYGSSNFTAYLNGVQIGSATPTAGTFPTNLLTQFNVGSRISAGVRGAFLNDRIRAAALYTTRLTNSELQSLTTL
jgi:hypothetical protein